MGVSKAIVGQVRGPEDMLKNRKRPPNAIQTTTDEKNLDKLIYNNPSGVIYTILVNRKTSDGEKNKKM